MAAGKDDLNPSAWRDVNEAVGDALGSSPPDPVLDRAPPDAPAHGTSPAKLVPSSPDQGPTAQSKAEDNGIRYQMLSARDLAAAEADRRLALLKEETERQNREAAARAHPAFRKDGSLLGEYAPLAGDATTPDTVDGIWWLGLPKAQQMWELGLDSEEEYARVHRDIEAVAYLVENRRRQLRQQGLEPEYVPLVIKRRKRRYNTDLFAGGKITTIKPMTDPDNVPGRRRGRRRP